MYERSKFSKLLNLETDSCYLDYSTFLIFKKDIIRYEKILDYAKYRFTKSDITKSHNFWENLIIHMEAYLKNYYRRLAGYAVYLTERGIK